MKKDKNHIDPIRELSIEKMTAYANGTLSPEEQHQVEKYLLSHPFEAEAMEGYLDNADALYDLPILKAKLQARTTPEQEQRTIPLWRKALPYAAVFLLLIISTVLVINFFQQDESFAPLAIKSEEAINFDKKESPTNPPTSIQAKAIEKESKSQQEAVAVAQSDDFKAKNNAKRQLQTDQDTEPLDQNEAINIEEDLMVSENAVPYGEQIPDLNVDSVDEKIAGIETDKNKPSVARSTRANALASSIAPSSDETDLTAKKKAAVSSTISGKVLDAETGESIPGANVLLKGSSIATSTGLDGSFEIAAKPKDVLIVNFIGMQQQEFAVSEEEDTEILLYSDLTQLSEVVVTSSETGEDNIYGAARPTIGFSAYKDYLRDNLRYPPKAQEAGTEGKVRLKLSISATGSIEKVEVLKSLGDGCDEEAIRLVKEGPKWQPAKKGDNPVASSNKISVRFKME